MSETRMNRYLPVRVAGQDYLIGMDIVLTVQQVTDTEPPPIPVSSAAPGTAAPDNSTDDAVLVVNLGVLFRGELERRSHQYAVVVATPAGNCVLLVDTIHAIVSVEPGAVQSLPYLLALADCPFNAMISAKEALLPVIDMTRLLERLHAVRPESETEVSHAG